MLKRDNSRRWLWLVLAASVFVRVGGVFYLGDVVDAPPLLTDQRSYHFLAVRLLEGHGCSFDKGCACMSGSIPRWTISPQPNSRCGGIRSKSWSSNLN
jgi:hypothetical protein